MDPNYSSSANDAGISAPDSAFTHKTWVLARNGIIVFAVGYAVLLWREFSFVNLSAPLTFYSLFYMLAHACLVFSVFWFVASAWNSIEVNGIHVERAKFFAISACIPSCLSFLFSLFTIIRHLQFSELWYLVIEAAQLCAFPCLAWALYFALRGYVDGNELSLDVRSHRFSTARRLAILAAVLSVSTFAFSSLMLSHEWPQFVSSGAHVLSIWAMQIVGPAVTCLGAAVVFAATKRTSAPASGSAPASASAESFSRYAYCAIAVYGILSIVSSASIFADSSIWYSLGNVVNFLAPLAAVAGLILLGISAVRACSQLARGTVLPAGQTEPSATQNP